MLAILVELSDGPTPHQHWRSTEVHKAIRLRWICIFHLLMVGGCTFLRGLSRHFCCAEFFGFSQVTQIYLASLLWYRAIFSTAVAFIDIHLFGIMRLPWLCTSKNQKPLGFCSSGASQRLCPILPCLLW